MNRGSYINFTFFFSVTITRIYVWFFSFPYYTHATQPNSQNPNNGETALHTAVRTRDLKVVTLLSKYLADPNITNRQFDTPLTMATDNGDDDIVELLAPDTQKLIRDRFASVAIRPDVKLIDHSKALTFRSTKLDTDPFGIHQQGSTGNYSDLADDILKDDSSDIEPVPAAYQMNSLVDHFWIALSFAHLQLLRCLTSNFMKITSTNNLITKTQQIIMRQQRIKRHWRN